MKGRSPAAAPGEFFTKEVSNGKRKEAGREEGHAGDDGSV
jgi:hypothetical protein